MGRVAAESTPRMRCCGTIRDCVATKANREWKVVLPLQLRAICRQVVGSTLPSYSIRRHFNEFSLPAGSMCGRKGAVQAVVVTPKQV